MIGEKTLNSILPENEEQTSWLIVFADMMTLLLVFFILLYTLSSFETGKYKTAVSKIKTQLENDSELTAFAELMELPETLDTQIIIEDIMPRFVICGGDNILSQELVTNIGAKIINENTINITENELKEDKTEIIILNT